MEMCTKRRGIWMAALFLASALMLPAGTTL
jgi:hypothetical protein